MKTHKIASTLLALSLAATLVACGGKPATSTYAQEALSEASGVKVTAENADGKSNATTEQAVTVEKGGVIVVSPDVEKGSFRLTITSSDGNTVYNEIASGKVLYTVEVDPGTYTVSTTAEAGTTGWMTVFAQSADDLKAQSDSLKETLEKEGLDPSEVLGK